MLLFDSHFPLIILEHLQPRKLAKYDPTGNSGAYPLVANKLLCDLHNKYAGGPATHIAQFVHTIGMVFEPILDFCSGSSKVFDSGPLGQHPSALPRIVPHIQRSILVGRHKVSYFLVDQLHELETDRIRKRLFLRACVRRWLLLALTAKSREANKDSRNIVAMPVSDLLPGMRYSLPELVVPRLITNRLWPFIVVSTYFSRDDYRMVRVLELLGITLCAENSSITTSLASSTFVGVVQHRDPVARGLHVILVAGLDPDDGVNIDLRTVFLVSASHNIKNHQTSTKLSSFLKERLLRSVEPSNISIIMKSLYCWPMFNSCWFSRSMNFATETSCCLLAWVTVWVRVLWNFVSI